MNVSRALILVGVAAGLLNLFESKPHACAAGITPIGAAYAAIAYSPKTGLYGYSHGQATLQDAHQAALKSCAASDARIVTWVKNGFCALAVGDKNIHGTAWGSANQTSSTDTEQRALASCGKRTVNARLIVSLGPTGPVSR